MKAMLQEAVFALSVVLVSWFSLQAAEPQLPGARIGNLGVRWSDAGYIQSVTFHVPLGGNLPAEETYSVSFANAAIAKRAAALIGPWPGEGRPTTFMKVGLLGDVSERLPVGQHIVVRQLIDLPQTLNR